MAIGLSISHYIHDIEIIIITTTVCCRNQTQYNFLILQQRLQSLQRLHQCPSGGLTNNKKDNECLPCCSRRTILVVVIFLVLLHVAVVVVVVVRQYHNRGWIVLVAPDSTMVGILTATFYRGGIDPNLGVRGRDSMVAIGAR